MKIAAVQSSVLLKSKDLNGRGVLITGEARAWVLCIAEGQEHLISLRVAKPFSAEFEIPELTGEELTQVSLSVAATDARMLNPRKLSVTFELAAELGITEYPSPAGGGCKLTEEGFGRKLKDLRDHEGLDNRELVELLLVARRFRLPGGAGVILGRDQQENAILKSKAHLGTIVAPVNCPGPTAIVTSSGAISPGDLELAKALVAAYSRSDRLAGNVILTVGEVARPYDREPFKQYQIC